MNVKPASPKRLAQLKKVATEDPAYTWSGQDILSVLAHVERLRGFIEHHVIKKGAGIMLPLDCQAINLLNELDGVAREKSNVILISKK